MKPSTLFFYTVLALSVWTMFAVVPNRSSWAYIPPSQFLMQELAKKHQGFKGVRIRSTVSGIKDGKPTGVQFRETTVVDFGARMFRSRAQDMSGKELYVMERRFDGSGENQAPAAIRLLIDPNVANLASSLKNLGIPVRLEEELLAAPTEEERRALEVQALRRVPPASGASSANPTVAWVVGRSSKPVSATDRSPQDPQLWLEKDAFLPLRLIAPAPDGMGSIDVRYEGYRFVREFPVPRTIETQQLRAELLDAVVNPELSELKAPARPGYSDAGNEADSGVRDLIRQYYGSVR